MNLQTQRRALLGALVAAAGAPAATALAATGPASRAGAPGSRGETPSESYAWGEPGSPKAVTRTIEIAMSDTMRFTPDSLAFTRGETVRLRVRNRGKVMHELVLGTQAELDAHAALMRKFPGMKHHESYMVHVAPGRSGEIVWTFSRAGRFRFACLIAGHYSAGMVGDIEVSERR